MATATGSTYLSITDLVKRQLVDESMADIIEVLAAYNPIVQDANIMEGNLQTGHLSVQRATQPSGTWRRLNAGVSPSKSTTVQRTDTCAMLEDYSIVDKALADLSGNAAAFRASEDNAFIGGMGSTVATAIFYADHGINSEQPMGLSARYDSLTGDYADQILDGEGVGSDNCSIWLVTWGPKTCSLIYPRGSQVGLQSRDLGEQTILDPSDSTKRLQAYVTHFKWDIGLALMDYRYVLRICNIDVSDLTADAATGADLLDLMLDAYYSRPTESIAMEAGGMTSTFWYAPKTVAKYLHKQAMNKSNVNLSLDEVGGKKVTSFLGAPIHVCDNLVLTESTIS